MKNKYTVKLSENGKEFLERFCANYKLAHRGSAPIHPSDALELIANYFKDSNIEYLEAIKQEATKNGFK